MNKRTALSCAFSVIMLSTIVATPVDWKKVEDAVYTFHLAFCERLGVSPELVVRCIEGVLQDSAQYTWEERLAIAFSFMTSPACQLRGGVKTIFDCIHTIPDLARGENNRTPLMHAAIEGYIEVVTLLLDVGADPTMKDVENKTAFDLARELRVMPREEFYYQEALLDFDSLEENDAVLLLLKAAMGRREA